MKLILLIVILNIGFMAKTFGSEMLEGRIKFATVSKAKVLLTQEDEFTKSWSQFDIDSRMHKQNSTKEELFDYISQQARDWTVDEKNNILSIIESIDKQITQKGYQLDFPEEIHFIKTTAQEEGGAAGYTRANYVVLKDESLKRKSENLKNTVIHELFHVLSRSNPEFRENMYGIIGFKLMNSIEYPENLKNYRITNPDAPQTDSYINLNVNGESVDCMMILYSNKDYNGEDFFKYLNIGFLKLKGDKGKSIDIVNHKAVIYSLKDVSGFFEQVGENTKYIIHPEEIMAENFTLALLNKEGLPDQDIVNKINIELKK